MYNRELLKQGIYEKYANVDLNDDFYKTEIKLENKSINFKFRKIVAIIIFCLFVGTVGYATYQFISKLPKYNYFGESIKFNDKYENYSTIIDKKVAESENHTNLTLYSTNYDGGFVVLDFNFKFSDEDLEYLEIGKRIFDDTEIQKNAWNYQDDYLKELKYSFNLINENCFIDDEEFFINNNSKQTIEKISTNEYKLYYYIFIPDELLENKERFKLTFKNIKIIQNFDINSLNIDFNQDKSYIIDKTSILDKKEIVLDGFFDCEINLREEVENCKVIYPSLPEIKYNILTQNIEYVKITPMQTIIKIKSEYNGIREHTFTINTWNNISSDYIGKVGFNTYNENKDKIYNYNNKSIKIIKYKNNNKEKWFQDGILPLDNFDKDSIIGSDMEIVDYLIVSNNDYKKIIYIYPIISEFENKTSHRKYKELNEFYEVDILE